MESEQQTVNDGVRLRKPTELVVDIIAYESGELDEASTHQFFANLIRTGLVWELQGHYGRTAASLIDAGVITAEGEIVEEDI